MARQRIPIWTVPLAITAGVVVAGVSVAVLVGASAPAPAQAAGPPVHIVYFQPPEPQIAPGELMDVGQVVDGYVHRPRSPSSPYLDVAYLYDEAAYEPARVSLPVGEEETARVTVYTAMQPQASADTSGPIAFNDPSPAFAEARRLRAIELDRRTSAPRATADRDLGVDGPKPSPDYQSDNAFF